MATTLLANVSSHVMTEILSLVALQPLRTRVALLPALNASSIDGLGSTNRKIPKLTEIADAVSDTEGVEFNAYETLAYGTPVTLTPSGKVQGVEVSTKALRAVMPGATYQEIIAAVERGSPEVIPLLKQIAVELREAHARPMEQAALALFASLTDSAGTTNTALTFDAILDATTAIVANKPAHRAFAAFIDQKGISDLRGEMIATEVGALWGEGYGAEFLNSVGAPPENATAPWGNILGVPIVEVDSDLQDLANADVDRVGGLVCYGRGVTGEPNTLRGFAEACSGHELTIGVEFDLEGNTVKSIGRAEWAIGEHTDEHGVKLIYKAT
jgi:hypothetical protein